MAISRKAYALLLLAALASQGCRMMPPELNLGPLYRHRIAPSGEVAVMDVLWPIIHYESLPEGGYDFRVRPLYRKVHHEARRAEEHQFLFPLGRAASDPEESSFRLFPLAWWRQHRDERDQEDIDWYFLFPLFWGGRSESGEDYFAFFPLLGRIPEFLSYDEVGWFLFPLRVWSEKGRAHTRSVLWPLAGTGWGDAEGDASWWRVLPFFAASDKPGERWHCAYLWPLFSHGEENLGGRDPRSYWFLFPLFGRSRGSVSASWTLLWPFFRSESINPESTRWDGPWPLFRYVDETAPGPSGEPERFRQWWLAPFYAATDSERQWARVVLFPLIWLRDYHDQAIDTWGTYVLPFFWSTGSRRAGGYERRLTRLFPLLAVEGDSEGGHAVRLPDPIPWSLDQGEGYREFFDFLWNLYTRRRRGDRVSVATPANLLCHDIVGGTTTWSIPFLFHTEHRAGGPMTLRLLHLFPIRIGGAARDPGKEP